MPKIATADRVDREQMLEFVRPRHHCLLLTTRADGSPQLSPVTCGVDEAGRGTGPGVACLGTPADLATLTDDPEALLERCVRTGVIRTPGFPATLDAWAKEFISSTRSRTSSC